MADFVAVIRKAVDGLANNTPENRAKVYDKARSAVVRQLENMKPRPPEELLNRQILKLDTAIAEVEGEYSEALPAAEEEQDYAEPAPVAATPDVSSPYYEETVAEEQRRHEEEPVAAAPEPEAELEHPPAPAHHVPVEEEPYQHYADHRAQHEQEPEVEERYADHGEPAYAEPAHVEPSYAPAEPEYAPAEPVREEAPSYFTTTEEPHYAPRYEEPVVEHEPEPVAAEDHAHQHWVGQDTPAEETWPPHDEQPAHHTAEERHEEPEQRVAEADVFHENEPLPYAASYSAPSPYYDDAHTEHRPVQHSEDVHFGEVPEFAPEDRQREAPRETQSEAPAETPKQPSAVVEDFSSYFQDAPLDLPAKASPGLPRADEDPFAPQPGQKDDKERSPWDDLEALIGYDGTSANPSANAPKSEFDTGVAAEGIPAAAYRTKKKPRRNYAAIVLSMGGLVLLAGGAYALWANRETLNDMVGGLVQSAQTGTSQTPATTETASTPATTPVTTPAANGQQPNARPSNGATTDDGSVTGTKFTQRLMKDGTEKDEGAGPGVAGQPVTAEGQSVYQQNESAPAATTQTAQNTTAPAGQTPPGQQPAAAAAASGHRMFLYEEVLGQTVPTAIEGTVSWSLQSEQDASGKPSATVQGQINIPGRGLSALITFKRNTDPSLPASHLVEIVFSVGAGFEGGAIDSVQRIAMKSTEQDRGNALIAVPAKITDDFHMIALNDFPDALKTNLELMRTRDWIDIPVSYRNGRRALLTLQKGADGKAAFDTALREWSTAAPVTNNQ